MQRQDMAHLAETGRIGSLQGMKDSPGIPGRNQDLEAGHITGKRDAGPVRGRHVRIPQA